MRRRVLNFRLFLTKKPFDFLSGFCYVSKKADVVVAFAGIVSPVSGVVLAPVGVLVVARIILVSLLLRLLSEVFPSEINYFATPHIRFSDIIFISAYSHIFCH